MTTDQSDQHIRDLCRDRELYGMLEKYLALCASRSTEGGTDQERRSTRTAQRISFPNLAGFCRFLGISTEELEAACADYPHEYGLVLTALEDEALNSSLSPTLVSGYLKRRLGYDGAAHRTVNEQLEISFEHDVMKDGE